MERQRFACAIAVQLTLSLTLASAMLAQSSAPPLTAEQQALVFGNPGAISLNGSFAEVPLEGTDRRGFYKCTYLKIFLNGRGPFTFLFDTGTGFNIVSSKLIDAARLPIWLERGGIHDAFKVHHVRISNVEISDMVFLREDDLGVDGILGFKAFGDMNLLFKLQRRELVVSREPIPLPGSFELPYTLFKNIPRVPVTIGSKQVPTLLDTGDDAYAWEVRSEDLSGATLSHPPKTSDTVFQQGQEAPTSITSLASPVMFGPIVLRDAVVAVNDGLPVPDFGVDYLKEFDFEFEPGRMVVVFQPVTGQSGKKITGNLSPGFALRFDAAGTVKAVVAGSAPDKRGMKAGDTVLEINGRPGHDFDPRAWDSVLSAHAPLAVKWKHGATEQSARFPVVELR